jgi:hypothetical protein
MLDVIDNNMITILLLFNNIDIWRYFQINQS